MRLSDERGFFLLDALLCVFILSSICILCFLIYGLMDRYEKGYESYQSSSNGRFEQILSDLNQCQGCALDEHD